MKQAMRVFGVAVTFALIYALPSFPIEGLSNLGIRFSFTNAVDMWPLELGLPGFLAGVLFALSLALSGKLMRFEGLSTGELAARGAGAGALVGAFYLSTVWPEPASLVAVVLGLAIGLGALAGPGSALLFRMLARRRSSEQARVRA